MEVSTLVWMMPLAVVLDLGLRYPHIPHPVSLVGRMLDALESRIRPLAAKLQGGSPGSTLSNGEFRAGLLALLVAVALSVMALRLLGGLPFVGGWILILLCYSGLALGHLLRVGRKALAALERGDIEEGRLRVSHLVSRDLREAEPRELYRALAESLAENFNDAFIAPLFWLTLGGPAGLWAYKTVSTADSMWGYHMARWEYFGKAAARADDVLAFVPARLSSLLLWLTAYGMGGATRTDAWPGWRTVCAQARRMESPNAGWPMAVAAWMHGASMGGPTTYRGELVDKPRLGPLSDKSGDVTWDGAKLRGLMFHLFVAGLAGTIAALLCLIVVLWV